MGPVLLSFLSFIVIAVTTYTLGKYWVDIYSKYQEKKDLEKELTSLKDEEEELKVDVNKLQDADYIARYAREKYYYSKMENMYYEYLKKNRYFSLTKN